MLEARDVDSAELDTGCGPFKPLLSGKCIHDCGFCTHSTEADGTGTTPGPREVVERFLRMRENGFRSGLFLSSGVLGSAERAQEMLAEAAELARGRGFEGYLHTKVMPGAPRSLVERCAEVSDRLSPNVETPPGRMSEVASTLDYGVDVERRLRWAAEAGAPSGATTQMVVGCAGESDREVVEEASRFYDRFGLERVYYSGFRPLNGTAMEEREGADGSRERRLYRMDWLRRVYGFDDEELRLGFRGDAVAERPKVRIAEALDLRFDPEEASFDELLRVPGIGPKRARRISRGEEVDIPERATPYLEGQTRLRDFG